MWNIVILIIVVILGKFTYSLLQDKKEIKEISLINKFSHLRTSLNKDVFSNEGKIRIIDYREFHLVCENANSKLTFFYSTGLLKITWIKFTSSTGEVKFHKMLRNAWSLTPNQQEIAAEDFFEEGEAFFINKNLPGVYKSVYLYNQANEQKIISNYSNDAHEFNIKQYTIDVMSDGLIKKIDDDIKRNRMDLRDMTTTLHILGVLNNGIEVAKNSLDNDLKYDINEQERETILKSIYTNVYYSYFED